MLRYDAQLMKSIILQFYQDYTYYDLTKDANHVLSGSSSQSKTQLFQGQTLATQQQTQCYEASRAHAGETNNKKPQSFQFQVGPST
jgi:hypothetical protein